MAPQGIEPVIVSRAPGNNEKALIADPTSEGTGPASRAHRQCARSHGRRDDDPQASRLLREMSKPKPTGIYFKPAVLSCKHDRNKNGHLHPVDAAKLALAQDFIAVAVFGNHTVARNRGKGDE